MQLPGLAQPEISLTKLTEYLLNMEHPDGRAKARFFLSAGFRLEDPGVLARALIQHARNNEVSETSRSAYGTKYVVDGLLISPTGGPIHVRAVWLEEPSVGVPRLVTAYPEPSAAR